MRAKKREEKWRADERLMTAQTWGTHMDIDTNMDMSVDMDMDMDMDRQSE